MVVLEHEDIVNMICGLNCSGYDTGVIDKCGGKGLYSYTGGLHDIFRWERHKLNGMDDRKLLELYRNVKQGMERKKDDTHAMARVQCEVKMKRCFFKCGNCGNEEIGKEDQFCSVCGKNLKREFEE